MIAQKKFVYKIKSILIKDTTYLQPGKITVFVGANNCGKTRLLKDLLGFITGAVTPAVILNKIEDSKPETWEILQESYDLKIKDTEIGQQIISTMPTLEKYTSTNGFGNNAAQFLNNLLKNNESNFKINVGNCLVTYLNTENRLNLANSKKIEGNFDNRSPNNALEALYLADAEKAKIQEYL